MIDFQLTVKSLQSSVPMHHQNNESQIEPVDLRLINQSKALFLSFEAVHSRVNFVTNCSNSIQIN